MASVTLDWIQLAAVVGTLQGLLLTGVLFTQRNNRTANRLLAALMIAFTIYLATVVYYGTGVFRVYPHFFGYAYVTPWIFGPLTYLYAVAASDRAWRFERRHYWHFAAPAFVLLVALPYFLMSGADKLSMYDQLATGNVPRRLAVIDPSKFISGIAYSIATVRYLRLHGRRIEENYSNVARVNLKWLLWLAGAAAATWLLATVLAVVGPPEGFRDDYVALAIAVIVYGIGYRGLRQPEVFRYQTAEFAVVRLPDAELEVRYERSGLDEAEAKALESTLRRVMDDEQPWKNSELTLSQLAERIGRTPHKLSEVLNSQVGQTFYDFVNGYRVREVQRRIKDGEAQRLKILALALDAGFASKSTFNQVFKKHTNLTPSDFRQAVGG
jgi:AraC-like DNA-binding protein